VEHGSTGNRTTPGDAVEHGSTGSRPGDGSTLPITVGALLDGVCVADDGPGPPDGDPDVFEAGDTTGSKGPGLAIVERIGGEHG
jgi:signal transduction histidine kinase